MNKKSRVIAIDGPSGSGKSTVAKKLAQKLSLTYLDTGAMFRAIAFHLFQKGILFSDIRAIQGELEAMKFLYAKSELVLVEIDGVDLTQKIRKHEVSKMASEISQIPSVREYLKARQRLIASERPSILEGRDIGTVIFPDAALKFYLDAHSLVRAQRRFTQLENEGMLGKLSIESIHDDIKKRDELDRFRDVAPLIIADDAINIDTTELHVDEVIGLIASKFYEFNKLFE